MPCDECYLINWYLGDQAVCQLTKPLALAPNGFAEKFEPFGVAMLAPWPNMSGRRKGLN